MTIEQIEKDLVNQGLSVKYNHPGIYCLKINQKIVYIGKSRNMIHRIATHIYNISTSGSKKYRILNKCKQNNIRIQFDVLYYSQYKNQQDIDNDIGYQEGKFIREYVPMLNYQIPKGYNWHKYRCNTRLKYLTYEQFITEVMK